MGMILWADDQLGRREDAKFLQDFLIARVKARAAAKLPSLICPQHQLRLGARKDVLPRPIREDPNRQRLLCGFD
jgi:hypothetical protein